MICAVMEAEKGMLAAALAGAAQPRATFDSSCSNITCTVFT
jgi:hypothetical protein